MKAHNIIKKQTTINQTKKTQPFCSILPKNIENEKYFKKITKTPLHFVFFAV